MRPGPMPSTAGSTTTLMVSVLNPAADTISLVLPTATGVTGRLKLKASPGWRVTVAESIRAIAVFSIVKVNVRGVSVMRLLTPIESYALLDVIPGENMTI